MNHLDTLPNIPDNMKFVCLSFLTSKDGKYTVTGLRFGGAYSTYEDACKQAKAIQQLDPYHHVFVGDSGKWLPFDPDPNSEAVKDSEYADEKLNELMKGHKDNQEKAKMFHELRKNEKMIDNINDNIKEKEINKKELTEKLSEAKTQEEMTTLSACLESVEEQLKKMELKLKECTENENKLKSQTELPNVA